MSGCFDLRQTRDHIERVTFWGLTDRRTGGRPAPLIFDGNNQPKPRYASIIAVLLSARPDRAAITDQQNHHQGNQPPAECRTDHPGTQRRN
jgi:hypothetical protein